MLLALRRRHCCPFLCRQAEPGRSDFPEDAAWVRAEEGLRPVCPAPQTVLFPHTPPHCLPLVQSKALKSRLQSSRHTALLKSINFCVCVCVCVCVRTQAHVSIYMMVPILPILVITLFAWQSKFYKVLPNIGPLWASLQSCQMIRPRVMILH